MSAYNLVKGLVASLALAATVSAVPLQSKPRSSSTFNINIHNNCAFDKSFALYQITSDFQMVQKSDIQNIPAKGQGVIAAPYQETGMRLSGHAEWPIGNQWNAQALFEYGYTAFMGMEGIAYDLSMMQGSDSDIGLQAAPVPNGSGSSSCESKTCFPWDCPLSQGWTNENQVNVGSPADTTCMKGVTDFTVVFCPSSSS